MQLPSERSPARLSCGSLGELQPLEDFRVPTFSGSGSGRGALDAVGFGCAPGHFDATQPGVVALARSGGCMTFEKARNAERAGALALLVAGPSVGRRGVPSATLAFPARLPVVLVSARVARALRPGDDVSLSVDATVSRGSADNVIAEAGKGGRVVMAGAHLDSVPAGPGINDNASGVATLLEAADALGPHPRGRVRLAFWAAEEIGLVGSRHYVRTLPRERRDEIAAYLNLDMVGSPNAVPSVYSDADEQLTRVLRRAHPGHEAGVPVEGRSDHGPFADEGIAVAGFYTGSQERGPGGRPRDPCYHLPCDTLANVDRPVLLRTARATAEALREIEDEP